MKKFVSPISLALAAPFLCAAEKYPTPIPRNGMVAAVTQAFDARLAEVTNPAWLNQVNRVDNQIAMSASAIAWQIDLAGRALSAQEKAYRMLGQINSDVEAPQHYRVWRNVSPTFPEIGYSAQYNVVRVKWARDIVTGTCKALRGAPPSLENYDFTIAEEAEYQIYRNGRRVATIAGAIVTGPAGTTSTPGAIPFGWVNFRVVGIPYSVTPNLGASNFDLNWYDFDPYPGPLGASVSYEIRSVRKGCPGVVPPGGGGLVAGHGPVASTVTSGVVWFDSDGDSIPDFMPNHYAAMKRAELPGGVVPGFGKVEVTAPESQGMVPVTVRNVGLGTAVGVQLRCEGSSANVLSQPPNSLLAGQSVTVMVWRFWDTKCRPVVTGSNTNNLPFRTDRF